MPTSCIVESVLVILGITMILGGITGCILGINEGLYTVNLFHKLVISTTMGIIGLFYGAVAGFTFPIWLPIMLYNSYL